LFERFARDLEKGDHSMAVRRLEGYLASDPLNAEVLEKLASIFDAYDYRDRAGRYFYLLPRQSQNRSDAIKLFETTLGSDPTLILKKLITKRKFAFSRLDDRQLLILDELLNRSKIKEGTTPKFLQALERHIKTRNRLKCG
jgi:hypothetical protein